MALLDDLDRRREDESRNRENSARLAQAYASFMTTGTGTLQYESRIDFGLTFIERPFVSHAAACDTEQVVDVFSPDSPDIDEAPLPLITGFVTKWDQDERGFYVGCWLAVRVHYPVDDVASFTSAPEVEMEHYFTFAAIALKDIPIDREDAIASESPYSLE